MILINTQSFFVAIYLYKYKWLVMQEKRLNLNSTNNIFWKNCYTWDIKKMDIRMNFDAIYLKNCAFLNKFIWTFPLKISQHIPSSFLPYLKKSPCILLNDVFNIFRQLGAHTCGSTIVPPSHVLRPIPNTFGWYGKTINDHFVIFCYSLFVLFSNI